MYIISNLLSEVLLYLINCVEYILLSLYLFDALIFALDHKTDWMVGMINIVPISEVVGAWWADSVSSEGILHQISVPGQWWDQGPGAGDRAAPGHLQPQGGGWLLARAAPHLLLHQRQVVTRSELISYKVMRQVRAAAGHEQPGWDGAGGLPGQARHGQHQQEAALWQGERKSKTLNYCIFLGVHKK